jgi:dihydroorotate dehydrogenase (fumarate)/dihydroorotate dehydrogenase
VYERWLRPALFRLSADQAHTLARLALRLPAIWDLLGAAARASGSDPRLRTDLVGLALDNPIGLAPGFDKSGELLASLTRLGFGYVVVGSITREPRWGNPFPRLVRYPERQSIANSMGLPNRGLSAAVQALSRPRPSACPIIGSVAGFSAHELQQSAIEIEPHVEAVEIGLVCPNTTETERLEELRIFSTLADGLASRVRKPVFVKLPPHHSAEDRARVFAMLDVCVGTGVHGVSVSGTRQIVEPRLGSGRGSLAGRDVFDDSLRVVADVAERSAGRLAIKASGGAFSGADALRLIEAGATTVEVYSAFIFRGWDVAGRINRELAFLLDQRGAAGLAQLAAGAGSSAPSSHRAPRTSDPRARRASA